MKALSTYLRLVTLIILTSLLISCSSVSIEDYQDTQPAIDLEAFFTGELLAYGMIRDRSGKVIRHFKAQLDGRWENGVGTLDEVFLFNDGQRQTRIWTMTPDGQGNYIGTAGDVDGSALIQSRGQAVRLQYRLRIPYKGDQLTVSMDDWMYQVEPGMIINETVMTKWGFQVATITLVIINKSQLPALSIIDIP